MKTFYIMVIGQWCIIQGIDFEDACRSFDTQGFEISDWFEV